ncbi:hypothetical protein ACOT7R_08765 [Clostridium perfringens]|uniref:hypothetical protein n=1 Tax=Clostridium perfringens TaxID=1502 RepID=UPI003BA85BB0
MAIYFTQNTNNVEDIEQMNNVIDKVNKVNTEATSNIGQLTDLNNKAQELSNNIQQALPINTGLKENIKIGQPLVQEATTKNTELQASLEKTKEFIEGLDGSQNIPQLRLDVTELQNGLKSNQALAYTGNSISANDTLEGRTEGMRIGGKTMYKKADGTYTDTWEEGVTLESFGEKEGNKISILSHGKNLVKTELNFLCQVGKVNNSSNFECNSIPIGKISFSAYDGDGNKINDSNIAIWFKDKNKNNIEWWSFADVREVVLKKEAKYIQIFTNNNLSKDTLVKSIMITIEPHINFEPYKEDKKDILIKEPLRGLDENTCDIMYEDNGQVKIDKYIHQYTFTGDENFALNASRDDYIRFVINTLPQPVNTGKAKIISNNFPSNSDSITKETVFGYEETGIVFCILKLKLTTPNLEGFKAWLKANPTTIVYQLATPVTEVVENCVDIDLDTFGEKTYFSIENSIKGTLDFKVPSNIASIVQNTAREVNNIWDVINNLLVPSLIDINKNVAMSTIKNNLK